MKATKIIWDVDMNDVLDQLEEMSVDDLIKIIGNEHLNSIMCLPNEIEIPEDMEDDDAVSDYLSDVTGFCHKGFEIV